MTSEPSVSFQELSSISDSKTTQQILDFFDHYLGAGYISLELLEQDILNPSSLVDLALFQEHKIVGVCLTRMLTEKDRENSYVKAFAEHGILDLAKPFKAGLFGTIAVDPDHRGKGIGKALYERSENFMQSNRATLAITLSWESGKEDSSGPLLEKAGYKKVVTLHEYWKLSSLEQNSDCPNCGPPPCLCSATLMKKNLKPKEIKT